MDDERETVLEPGRGSDEKVSDRFGRAIDSLGGDREMLADIAGSLADEFSSLAGQIVGAANAPSWERVSALAHQVRSTWQLFADSDENLPDQLEQIAAGPDVASAHRLALLLSQRLTALAADLRAWLVNERAR